MQPSNNNERKKAFLNFLLLFVVSVILITATVFSGREVPFRQNNQLLRDMAVVQNEKLFSTEFFSRMNHIGTMLDSINKIQPQDASFLHNRIEQEITSLDMSVNTDSSDNKPYYKNIVLTLKDLSDSKKQLRDMNGKDLDKGALQEKIDALTEKNDELRSKTLTLQQQVDTLVRRNMR
ncbi:hypothetical protein BH11BAC4_BH11BAC4_22270 [soil metagenome]